MKKSIVGLLSILAVNFTFAQSTGTLDLHFGDSGHVHVMAYNKSFGNSLVVQKDGKIVVVGTIDTGFASNFCIARYNPNGTLDSTFGHGGITISSIGTGGQDYANIVAIQNDDKIIVAGNSNDFYNGIALARYNKNGSIDTTFGDKGKVITSTGIYRSIYINSIALMENSDIILAGYDDYIQTYITVLKYNTNGNLVNNFGHLGAFTFGFGNYSSEIHGLAIQNDGKIIVGGYSIDEYYLNCDLALARITTSGALDKTFGKNGIAVIHSGGIDGLALQNDGKIVAVGNFSDSLKSGAGLLRFNTKGSLDSTFGDNGMSLNEKINYFGALVILNDDKIVYVAYVKDTASNFALCRYNIDGSPDKSFGSDGITVNTIPGNFYPVNVTYQFGMDIIVGTGLYLGKFMIFRYHGGNTYIPENIISRNITTISPNPITGTSILKTNYDKSADLKIIFYNSLGKIVHTGNIKNNMFEISKSYFYNGIFLYQIFDKNKVIDSGKILVN